MRNNDERLVDYQQIIIDICKKERYFMNKILSNIELVEYLYNKYGNAYDLKILVISEYRDEHPICKNGTVRRAKSNFQFACDKKGNKCQCTREKVEQSNIKKYGTKSSLSNSDVIEKRFITNQRKYGSKSPMSDPEVRQKVKNTNIKRYGVENVFQCGEIKDKIEEYYMSNFKVRHNSQVSHINEKRKKTCIENYGVDTPFKSNIIQEKIKNTIREKYNRKHVNQRHIKTDVLRITNLELIDLNSQYNLLEISDKLNVSYDWVVRKMKHFNIDVKIHSRKSAIEQELHSFLKSHNIDFKTNNRKILNGNEIDILCEKFNFGVEINGSYWHSELSGKGKKYHLNKTEKCILNNIHLMHIWEHTWKDKKDIYKSIILSKLYLSNRIGARSCSIKKIEDNKTSAHFLNDNHIQGYIKSKVSFGLYYNNELIYIMTFGKPRYDKSSQWELLRLCNKKNIIVIGGANKLFKHFITNYSPTSIISYSDRSLFDGNVYKNLNFDFIKNTNPAYYYTTDYRIFYNRLKYQKHKLKKLLKLYDDNLTEWENMKNNNFDRIWDCGNSAWRWKND